MSNDYFNPPNSVWPNGLKRDGEGYVTFYPLGTNKVDISTITWPVGDKLVSPFVYQNGELVGFVDTKALTVSGSATTTMNYNHIEADFASISEGKLTVNAPNATVKKFSWAVNTGGETPVFVIIDFNTTDQETIDTVRTAKRVVDNKLYDANDNLIGTLDTSKIEVGGTFFLEPININGVFCSLDIVTESNLGLIISEFNSDLSSLKKGASMFFGCFQLTSFSSNLPSLTEGVGMFAMCVNLTSFSSDLPSLDGGFMMFSNCENLTSFSSDLSSLTNGLCMFQNCIKLTSFNSDLCSLAIGSNMFDGCKLDAASVKHILDTISTDSSLLTLGMGCNDTTEDKDFFAQEVGYSDMTSFLTAFQVKGLSIDAQYNGRLDTTYSLRKPSEDTLPVFVKLEETEKYANYTSEDGSKKYMLNWFHETTGSTEGYTQFNSLEEAVAHFNIKPIERN